MLLTGVLFCALCAGIAAASPKPLALRVRVLQRGEFAGFTLERPKFYRTAKAWVALDTSLTPAQVRAQVARLTREGFKEVLAEFLDDAQGPRMGLSTVMELGSAVAARAELAAEVRYETTHQAPVTFHVSTIPGAVGYGGGGGENITFADGRFLYLVGNAWQTPTTHNPRHAALTEAATKLYRRVHGR